MKRKVEVKVVLLGWILNYINRFWSWWLHAYHWNWYLGKVKDAIGMPKYFFDYEMQKGAPSQLICNIWKLCFINKFSFWSLNILFIFWWFALIVIKFSIKWRNLKSLFCMFLHLLSFIEDTKQTLIFFISHEQITTTACHSPNFCMILWLTLRSKWTICV